MKKVQLHPERSRGLPDQLGLFQSTRCSLNKSDQFTTRILVSLNIVLGVIRWT
jgi:hypothetical protein